MSERVTIIRPAGDGRIDFGVGELEEALERRGFDVAAAEAAPGNAGGHVISIGTAADSGGMPDHGVVEPHPQPESYSLRCLRRGDRTLAAGIGRDPAGAMYAALDIAEHVALGGSLAEIAEKDSAPRLAFRGLKMNIPLGSEVIWCSPEGRASLQGWFFDMDFWRRFLDTLARCRYNTLTLWNANPFEFMVNVEKYPGASDLPPDQIAARIDFFRGLFDLARDRGVATYVVNWNIHVSEAFARNYNVARTADESEVVKDYIREAVKTLVDTYPSLTGVGTCAGESMRPMFRRQSDLEPRVLNEENARWNEAWVRDTFGAALKEANRVVPLLHRSWNSRPHILREEFLDHYSGPVYVEVKLNEERMYSLPRPMRHIPDWVGPEPRGYRLLWHLRNDGIHLFRWGDPGYVREVVESCVETGAAGFFWGSEDHYSSPQNTRTSVIGRAIDGHAFHVESTRHHVTWTYEFEKFWLMFMLWGRLSYDPDLPDSLWEAHFSRRYGSEAGPALYRGQVVASKIIPMVEAFHWNAFNHEWDPEACAGGMNGQDQFRLTPQRHDFTGFRTALEFIFNLTLDERWLNIADYVNAMVEGREPGPDMTTPLQVADRLDQLALAAMDEIAGVTVSAPEGQCTAADLAALSDLGRYYAEKIRGATELMFFLRTNRREHHAAAVDRLQSAAGWWERLAADGDGHYAHPTHNWTSRIPSARNDAAMAQATITPARKLW